MDCSKITCQRCGIEATVVNVRTVEKFERTETGRVSRYAGVFTTIDCLRCGRVEQCVAAAPRAVKMTG
jgi:hypothetical protein